jgi:GAF domain-containing protein
MAQATKPGKRRVAAKRPAARKSAPKPRAKSSAARRLEETLEQQAATSEILRVISNARADAQPVFDMIAANALRLCDAVFSVVYRFDGQLIHIAALENVSSQGDAAFRRVYPCKPGRGGATQRAVLKRSIVHIPDVRDDPEYVYLDAADKANYRSVLSVPMLREGRPIGAIAVFRAVASLFPESQVELLKTFADQAVLAIENVRLFAEVQARNADLTEALEQKTATGEVLRVIASSPNDTLPVFDLLAQRAGRLCNAEVAVVSRFDGELIQLAAIDGVVPEGVKIVRSLYPMGLDAETVTARTIRSSTVVHIADVLADPSYAIKDFALAAHFRAGLGVPILRNGQVIGSIFVGRSAPGLFTESQVELLKTFADQAIIAIENVRLFTELQSRNEDLTETLDQQTATSEILRVISRSQTDVQPVFDTIAAATLRLCGARTVNVFTFDGELIHLTSLVNVNREYVEAIHQVFPRAPSHDTAAGRVVLARDVVTIPDVLEDREYVISGQSLLGGFRSILGVPLLRDGNPLGAIIVGRPAPGPFPDEQIALLKTFADQAVIAIENVRLFKELEARNADLTEALEQQTATSEILRVISQSPTDTQPVFDTIVAAAMKLCSASNVNAFTFDGELIHLVAISNLTKEGADALRRLWPRPPGRDMAATRAVQTCRTVIIPDVLEDSDFAPRASAVGANFRSILAVPLVREGSPIGAIAVGRPEPGPFPDAQIALLQTFADQAVIAIENVRLFKELEARNADLTKALDQQTATSEILRVISRSQTDVQPVFDTIVSAAKKLCDATSANVFTFDGELIHLAAIVNVNPEYGETVRQAFPRPPSRDTGITRAILTGSVVEIPDVVADPDYVHALRVQSVNGDFRSVLAVPLLREGKPIGAIAVGRSDPGKFPEEQIALLQTFADQAVIAIENVRLFKELESRNADLTESLEQQTATSDILSAISQSQTDTQPVFDTIAAHALKLCGANSVTVTKFDGSLLQLMAIAALNAEGENAVRQLFPRPPGRETTASRALLMGRVVMIPDIVEDPDFAQKTNALAGGFRSTLAVPLIHGASPIGVITVGRPEPGPFPDTQVALLQSFADQAVIAIENVRLFKELESRNADLTESLEQQAAISEILRVISSSPDDVKPMLNAVAERALKLCDAAQATIVLVDADTLRCAAAFGNTGTLQEDELMPLTRGSVAGRAINDGVPFQIEDLAKASEEEFPVGRELQRRIGHHTALAVPLMREDRAIGAIQLWRMEIRAFSENQIALVKTFADQAAIAIENVRLFKELQARTTELTRSVGELRALGEVGRAVSSTLDLETVLSTIVSRATQLAGMDAGSIYEYDHEREEFYLHTSDRLSDELIETLRASPIRKGEGALGRMAVTREPVQIHDIADDRAYRSRVRTQLIHSGCRALLVIPLLREDLLLGGLAVYRKTPGPFAPTVIELLKTFATQSALAIQNARLFREIEDKSRQLLVASQHKSEFLANMSHELRTPLNAIIGFSEVLAEKMFGEVNDKQAEYLADILDSGRHLLALINDILDLSKIEAGRMELNLDDFDLPTAIDNTMTLLRERALRREITLERAIDGNLGKVHADERKVKQVLLNLLSNALKFTPEGGRIDVRARMFDSSAEISVTDTGIGIAPEDQATVFEEFRQVGASSKKVEGTGLGLAISRKFIELHGGRIWVESEVGKGSRFAFTVPLKTHATA